MSLKSLPKISLARFRKSIVISVVVLAIFSLGFTIGKSEIKVGKESGKIEISREVPRDVDFSLFWKTWDSLEKNYFDSSKIIPENMIYGAIKGMVASLEDPYTVFLPPKENRVVQEDLKGTFEGVGIQIGFIGSRLAVIAPLADSPAEAAGVKAGDYIVGIKDEKKDIDRGTVGITLPEAVEIIRGRAGTTVTLFLIREGKEQAIETDIVRKAIDVPSVIYTIVDDKYAHVRLLKFSAETPEEWNKTIREIIKNPEIEGIILDMRNNPGGFLQGSVDLAAEFLELGSTVVYEENATGKRNEYKTERLGKLVNENVVILINKGSASASEILAGALRDNIGTKLIGETSFGKGTIQESIQVNGGAGLHVTIAKWITPSGVWINEVGLEPDIKIEDNNETEEDEQLQEAIKLLSG